MTKTPLVVLLVALSLPLRGDPPPSPAPALPRISVRGNHFVDPSGQTILFRGLSIADPDNLAKGGQWKRELFVAVQAEGANLVRLPVHPEAWRSRGAKAYLELLDQAVAWCGQLGMHVIIDWHSIGNLGTEMFQSPNYDTTRKETFAFWRTISDHFAGQPTVAFYELFNEPTHFGGKLGPMSWSEWRMLNEEMISIVRYKDHETIPLVAGFDWAYTLTELRYDPVRADHIGYVSHPYPVKRGQPWEPRWDEDFAFAAHQYPLIATEIGFEPSGEMATDESYGPRITKFLEERGIGWMAWVFDPDWTPRMLKSFDGYTLTGEGEFFRDAMHRAPAPLLSDGVK